MKLEYERRIADLEKALADKKSKDVIDAEDDRRVPACFVDKPERDDYARLLESRGTMFQEALNKYDASGTILEWMDGKEDHPLVLKALMTDRNALMSVFQHPAAGRMVALDRLRARLVGSANRPKLPKRGRLSKSPVGGPQARGIEYWNEYLKNHPRGS